jgi:hypothetical protein
MLFTAPPDTHNMTYIVKITLTDDTIVTFEYPAEDTIAAIIAFQDDMSEGAVYARNHLKLMEVDKKI